MSETKKLHKVFWVWEYEKEERWLNEIAQEGWALTCGGFCTYTFEKCEPGEYIIRVETLDNSSDFENFMGGAWGRVRWPLLPLGVLPPLR